MFIFLSADADQWISDQANEEHQSTQTELLWNKVIDPALTYCPEANIAPSTGYVTGV